MLKCKISSSNLDADEGQEEMIDDNKNSFVNLIALGDKLGFDTKHEKVPSLDLDDKEIVEENIGEHDNTSLNLVDSNSKMNKTFEEEKFSLKLKATESIHKDVDTHEYKHASLSTTGK